MPISEAKTTSPDTIPCKICGQAAPLYGAVDFNKSCVEITGKILPPSGVKIAYRRCPRCHFLFTTAFDHWSTDQFKQFIYNDDYIEIDPEYEDIRPRRNAEMILGLFDRDRSRLRVLDYGGGNGLTADILRGAGFRSAQTYDPFYPQYAVLPEGRFELVICIETLEHLPDPMAGIAALAGCCAEPGVVLISTGTPPADFDDQGLNWWYVGPRNGHISIFSKLALQVAWKRVGFSFGSFNDTVHLAYRNLPDFASHLLKPADPSA
jgi:2-polyprenyl-6-hydroxyphenyl methylase/3-demethylubiquinone-9 3-methyltransferase